MFLSRNNRFIILSKIISRIYLEFIESFFYETDAAAGVFYV
ncbi:hypothetical protein [Aquiflexum gelatinilyticum]|uniref:Uncharacterized protein n=1 Tax=Aquiflexum gelatinilyticum TaxID=2961943 RepID=A0A9X2T1I1_9BACT|nr:hypothetical protein [Aquiflexum gelatinilyticum]MCR9015981.1 hypothetical protein [Aquiflexum gelatinilyticum]